MARIKVSVERINGTCNLPHLVGDHFIVDGSRLIVPEGKHVCIWALQSMMPIFPILAARDRLESGHWISKVRTFSCPDPHGLVQFRLEVVDAAEEDPAEPDAPIAAVPSGRLPIRADLKPESSSFVTDSSRQNVHEKRAAGTRQRMRPSKPSGPHSGAASSAGTPGGLKTKRVSDTDVPQRRRNPRSYPLLPTSARSAPPPPARSRPSRRKKR